MNERKAKLSSNVVLIIIGLVFVLPLAWIALASFDKNASLAVSMPDFTMDNWVEVLTNKSNIRSFGNGLLVSLGASVLVVVLAGMAAYPLPRYEMKYKKIFMLTMLFMTCLPITTVMVPVFKIFVSINLYDNLGGMMLFMTASSMPYAMWMMKNFMDAVPMSLEEAAWVDGSGKFGGIRKVVLPMMLPGIFTIAIYTFTGAWGNFFVPFILLSTGEKFPPSIMLYQFFGSHSVAYGTLAAYSAAYAMPAIILYVITQKWMSKGFAMSGADKG